MGMLEDMQAKLAELEQRLYQVEHPAKDPVSLVPDPDEQSIMGPSGAEPRPLPDPEKCPKEWAYARLHHKYQRLHAIVGSKLNKDNWPVWMAVIRKYDWPNTWRAAEELQADRRWPDATEALMQTNPSAYPRRWRK